MWRGDLEDKFENLRGIYIPLAGERCKAKVDRKGTSTDFATHETKI